MGPSRVFVLGGGFAGGETLCYNPSGKQFMEIDCRPEAPEKTRGIKASIWGRPKKIKIKGVVGGAASSSSSAAAGAPSSSAAAPGDQNSAGVSAAVTVPPPLEYFTVRYKGQTLTADKKWLDSDDGYAASNTSLELPFISRGGKGVIADFDGTLAHTTGPVYPEKLDAATQKKLDIPLTAAEMETELRECNEKYSDQSAEAVKKHGVLRFCCVFYPHNVASAKKIDPGAKDTGASWGFATMNDPEKAKIWEALEEAYNTNLGADGLQREAVDGFKGRTTTGVKTSVKGGNVSQQEKEVREASEAKLPQAVLERFKKVLKSK